MSWNESGNGKDPWGRDKGQPVDLDKIAKEWQQRFGGIFGGKTGGTGGGLLIVGAILVLWALTGFYRVDEAERGVVQRFGEYTVTTNPGLHWHLPYPIEVVDIVNVNAVNNYPFKTDMLTADQQYVSIQMVVQYRRENPEDFLFEVQEPEQSLKDVTESALREVVGTSTLESLVTGERDRIAERTRETLQFTLDSYNAGIRLTSISIINLDYPEPVQAAVNDTQKATNDADRFKLEAERYANTIIPRARGEADRIMEDAEAYKDRVTRDADGQAARFIALLEEYAKAPRVTRDRLYIDAIEEVYARSNKILIDSEGSGNLMYLPIDKLIEGQNRRAQSAEASSDASVRSADDNRLEARDSARERRTRQ
jgi:membrane protease subunit HflK